MCLKMHKSIFYLVEKERKSNRNSMQILQSQVEILSYNTFTNRGSNPAPFGKISKSRDYVHSIGILRLLLPI